MDRFSRATAGCDGVDESPAKIATGVPSHSSSDAVHRRKVDRFTIPERPFDAAIFMCETFLAIRTNTILMSHLKSVAALLKRGGLYCIDVDRHDGVIGQRRRLWRERNVRIGPIHDVQEFHRPISWDDAMH
jgi:hypothetical protein